MVILAQSSPGCRSARVLNPEPPNFVAREFSFPQPGRQFGDINAYHDFLDIEVDSAWASRGAAKCASIDDDIVTKFRTVTSLPTSLAAKQNCSFATVRLPLESGRCLRTSAVWPRQPCQLTFVPAASCACASVISRAKLGILREGVKIAELLRHKPLASLVCTARPV